MSDNVNGRPYRVSLSQTDYSVCLLDHTGRVCDTQVCGTITVLSTALATCSS